MARLPHLLIASLYRLRPKLICQRSPSWRQICILPFLLITTLAWALDLDDLGWKNTPGTPAKDEYIREPRYANYACRDSAAYVYRLGAKLDAEHRKRDLAFHRTCVHNIAL